MHGRYYIRVRGRKVGPLTVEELHSLSKRGRFGRHFEVSRDGRQWDTAANFPELFADVSSEATSFDDDDADADDDVEPPPAKERRPPPRSRGRTRSPRPAQEDNLDIPLPQYVDPYDPNPSRPSRNTPSSGRSRRIRIVDDFDEEPLAASASAEPDDDLDAPIADVPDDDDEDIIIRRSQSRARRRGGRTSADSEPHSGGTAVPDSDSTDGEWNETPSSRGGGPRRRRSGGRQTSAEPEQAPPEPAAATESGAETEAPRRKGGFFGMFRRSNDEEDDETPHLLELRKMSDGLRKEAFKLKDITLVGTRSNRLPVLGHADSGDGIQTLGLLTMLAYQTRSTDIHLEPKLDGIDVRMRVDGSLVPIVHLPRAVAGRVAGVIKVLCEIDFTGQLGIQEGSFSAEAPGRRTDFRVSFTPSVHGQKLAIRVLDVANSPQSVETLGAPKSVVQHLTRVMKQNAGMILMCGPTGSGKTTTLYSLIRGIDRKSRNVMTIEDPVEYQIEDVTQSSVDAERGKNFSDMLRALLRQDPDVLLLGEIRDGESARIAMQATMTGHLVLSTVHAQDTFNTVFRLLDLGADPSMVASSLNIVLAQRLVRVLCPNCKKRHAPTEREKQRLGRFATDRIYQAIGCKQCLGTGYSGRRALFELLVTNDRLKELILKSPTPQEMRATVKGTGFMTLRDHGHQLVAEGVTTFTEVDQTAGLG